MKDLFPGYCKKTDEEIKALWNDGLITFDANVLLNLYRYSNETQKQITKLINKLSPKIFLTHQAGLEFHKNRFEVIDEQEKAYREFNDSLQKIEDELNSKSKHPFLSAPLQTKLNGVLDEVKSEIKSSEKYYSMLLSKDEIHGEISKLFNGKIEKPYDDAALAKLYEDGKKRYEQKVPPGFEDEKTKEGNRKYGDLVVWKQIIEKAKEVKKPIILVSDDRKRDWWWKLKNDKIIGPRQELVEEIKKEAGVDFHMYQLERFLEYGLHYTNEKANPKVIEEVKGLSSAPMKSKQITDITSEVWNKYKTINPYPNEQTEAYLSGQLSYYNTRMNQILDKLYALKSKNSLSEEENLEMFKLNSDLSNIDEKRDFVIRQLTQFRNSR